MSYRIIAEIILIGSSIGLGGIIFKKIPVLSTLSEEKTKGGFSKSKLMKRLRRIKLFKEFSYEKLLHKLLTKVRILSLKTDNKTSNWLKKLKKNGQRKRIMEDDNYWDEVRKATKR